MKTFTALRGGGRGPAAGVAATVAAVVLAVMLAACAGYGPGPAAVGQTEAEVAARMGPPTGRHALADGRTRLEYARGPFGRHTFMLDLDAQGRVASVQQVLTEARFNAIRAGMPRAELLAELGRPSDRRSGGWQGGEVWSWRYDAIFCQWFMVSVTDQGVVKDTAYGPDPLCDDDRHSNLFDRKR
jgi:hypothetical protein